MRPEYSSLKDNILRAINYNIEFQLSSNSDQEYYIELVSRYTKDTDKG